jgi:hypothetical protein
VAAAELMVEQRVLEAAALLFLLTHHQVLI